MECKRCHGIHSVARMRCPYCGKPGTQHMVQEFEKKYDLDRFRDMLSKIRHSFNQTSPLWTMVASK